MSRQVLILRPEPGNGASVARAKAKGLNALSFPLFEIQRVDWTAPPAPDFDALLLTSANAVHGLEAYHTLPVYTVGAATADAARSHGLNFVHNGSGGVDALLASLKPQKILHPQGEDATPVAPNAHEIMPVITYRSGAIEPAVELWASVAAPAIVLLHSKRSASHFAALMDQAKISRGHLSLVAISESVAEAAGAGWEAVALAAHPRDEAMLDAALALIEHNDGVD